MDGKALSQAVRNPFFVSLFERMILMSSHTSIHQPNAHCLPLCLHLLPLSTHSQQQTRLPSQWPALRLPPVLTRSRPTTRIHNRLITSIPRHRTMPSPSHRTMPSPSHRTIPSPSHLAIPNPSHRATLNSRRMTEGRPERHQA